MTTVSVIIATHGDKKWAELADRRANPSAQTQQGAFEVIAWHEYEGTLAGARNAAAEAAGGDWLCFLDGDDELDPGYLDAMRKKFRLWNFGRPADLRLNPILFVPAVEYVPGDAPPAIPDWDRSLIDLNCAVIGTLIPRYLFRWLGGFRELPSLEDWEVFLRCVEAGARMVPVRDAVYRVFLSEDGRNKDQTPYYSIRAEHRDRFDWANIASYKLSG